jgi:formylmethanofuran dehydrogenase subunit B
MVEKEISTLISKKQVDLTGRLKDDVVQTNQNELLERKYNIIKNSYKPMLFIFNKISLEANSHVGTIIEEITRTFEKNSHATLLNTPTEYIIIRKLLHKN